ncbi:hypothetical protein LAJ19_21400 (plasmid) [Deinococcus taeanensis]|uniref:hypothetical protein n=1 Tax=Deinococcus taeanensis TaxID=2737050 RepID=UPI001CDCE079|nr:hypothetical protein [Deinococcus taeanensis]UBV45543.1 hypothetical protein LAJ19_21400 [Deinococcus taeanensis]
MEEASITRAAVLLAEWAVARGVALSTSLTWAQRGEIRVWRSGVGWLIRPDGTVYPRPIVKRLSRDERLALPAVSLSEWSDLHGHIRNHAAAWATQGRLPAWRSGGAWLIAPDAQPTRHRRSNSNLTVSSVEETLRHTNQALSSEQDSFELIVTGVEQGPLRQL